MLRVLPTLLLLAGLLPGPMARANPLPAQERRLALVITANRGLEADQALHFANEEGLRVVDALVQVGGFLPENIEHIDHASPDAITQAFGRAVVRATEFQSQGYSVTLLVYYTGHAGADGLHLDGKTLSLEALKTAARVVPAQRRIFAIDACQAGSLFRSKGATLVELRSRPLDFEPPEDEAWITSSGPEEQAFEVDQRRGALFTHFFVSGARGGADFNGDQRVTLVELFDFVARQTSRAAATMGQVQTPRWGGAFSDFVLGDLAAAKEGLSFEGPIPYPVLVLNQNSERVAAEVPAGSGSFLALRPGSYQLVSVGHHRRPKIAEIKVAKGKVSLVNIGSRLVDASGLRTKGGLMVVRPWSIKAGYHMGTGEMPLRPAVHGVYIGVERTLGKGHWVALRVLLSGGRYSAPSVEGRGQRIVLQGQWTVDLAWRTLRTGPLLRFDGGWLHQTLGRAEDPRWGSWYGENTGRQSSDLGVVGGAAGWRVNLPLGPIWWDTAIAAQGQLILSNTPTPFGGLSVESGLSVRF